MPILRNPTGTLREVSKAYRKVDGEFKHINRILRRAGTVFFEVFYDGPQYTFEFIPPYVCENTMGKAVTELEVYGKSVQDGTPSPEAPVEIESVGGELTLGDSTITIPTLYGVGDVQDVLHVDHAQKRAWVERNFASIEMQGLNTYTYVTVYRRLTDNIRFGINVSVQGYPSTKASAGVICNFLEAIVGFTANITSIMSHTTESGYLYISLPYSILGINSDTDDTASVVAFDSWLQNTNPVFNVIYQLATPTIEELDYDDYKTLTASTATTVTTDSPVSPKIALTTYVSATPDPSTSYYAQLLIALGVEPADTLEEQEAQLTALGVDPWA